MKKLITRVKEKIKELNPKYKLRKKLFEANLHRLDANSHSRKAWSHFDLKNESSLIRFAEDKSVWDFSKTKSKTSSTLDEKRMLEITKQKGYDLSKATYTHFHPNWVKEKQSYPGPYDIAFFLDKFNRFKISKFEILVMDRKNMTEVGKIYILKNKEKTPDINELWKDLVVPFSLMGDVPQYMNIINKYFIVKYKGSNGYQFNPKKFKFNK